MRRVHKLVSSIEREAGRDYDKGDDEDTDDVNETELHRMSTSTELDSQNSIFPSIPAGGEWIEPFYSDILRSIQVAESPYLVIRDVM